MFMYFLIILGVLLTVSRGCIRYIYKVIIVLVFEVVFHIPFDRDPLKAILRSHFETDLVVRVSGYRIKLETRHRNS